MKMVLAFIILTVLIGCSDSPSRYHNHGTPGDGDGHLKVKPKPFGNMDITPDWCPLEAIEDAGGAA